MPKVKDIRYVGRDLTKCGSLMMWTSNSGSKHPLMAVSFNHNVLANLKSNEHSTLFIVDLETGVVTAQAMKDSETINHNYSAVKSLMLEVE